VLLELHNINAYYDKSHVLQDVSLEVAQGEVVALLGRNGSGRSTTLKTIMGLVNARSGSIRFHDADITNKTPFALAQAGIAFVPEDRRIFPNQRRDKPAKLSGGEQQMLAIARALIANPEIILLDEPMEGLAPLIARTVEEVIRRIKSEGHTILLVEQNAHVAFSLADRGYVLSNGRVVGQGTTDALRADTEMMHRYLAVT
jgi:branched-chain amino acid transport system ATP-binding protein